MGPFGGRGHLVHHAGLGWGGWLLWILLTIAFWALVVMAIIWLVRAIRFRGPAPRPAWMGQTAAAPPAHPEPGASAEQILAERFAHGQIDEAEYRSRLSVLRGGPPVPPPTAPPPPPPTEGPPVQ